MNLNIGKDDQLPKGMSLPPEKYTEEVVAKGFTQMYTQNSNQSGNLTEIVYRNIENMNETIQKIMDAEVVIDQINFNDSANPNKPTSINMNLLIVPK